MRCLIKKINHFHLTVGSLFIVLKKDMTLSG